MPPTPPSHCFVIGLSVYNSAQYYWLQIMINNNYIDKNGTLALTSDLICRPLCTLWCIQYHNHAWVHLAWKKMVKKINRTALISRDKTSHLHILCWQRANTEPLSSWSYAEEAIDPPVNLFSCISTAANPRRKSDLPPPRPLFPSTNMIPPEGSPQTSFLINACGWWDHPVSAN